MRKQRAKGTFWHLPAYSQRFELIKASKSEIFTNKTTALRLPLKFDLESLLSVLSMLLLAICFLSLPSKR